MLQVGGGEGVGGPPWRMDGGSRSGRRKDWCGRVLGVEPLQGYVGAEGNREVAADVKGDRVGCGR